MNSRKLMYIAIVVMCVIAVVLAVYLQSGKQPSSNRNTTNNVKTEESQETLKKEFDQMFNNVVELNDYDTSNIKKACANPLFSQKGLYICSGMV